MRRSKRGLVEIESSDYVKGRIKAGEGSLIGNAGEYYVMAELLKRGIVAALAPRNAPSFDILATKENLSVKIRVKTKSQGVPEWQWMVKKDGSIFRNLSKEGDFTILVDLAKETRELKFYIIPTYQIDKWLTKVHNDWLKTPGKHGRQHSQSNPKRNLSEKTYAEKLSKYLNKWDNLWK